MQPSGDNKIKARYEAPKVSGIPPPLLVDTGWVFRIKANDGGINPLQGREDHPVHVVTPLTSPVFTLLGGKRNPDQGPDSGRRSHREVWETLAGQIPTHYDVEVVRMRWIREGEIHAYPDTTSETVNADSFL